MLSPRFAVYSMLPGGATMVGCKAEGSGALEVGALVLEAGTNCAGCGDCAKAGDVTELSRQMTATTSRQTPVIMVAIPKRRKRPSPKASTQILIRSQVCCQLLLQLLH